MDLFSIKMGLVIAWFLMLVCSCNSYSQKKEFDFCLQAYPLMQANLKDDDDLLIEYKMTLANLFVKKDELSQRKKLNDEVFEELVSGERFEMLERFIADICTTEYLVGKPSNAIKIIERYTKKEGQYKAIFDFLESLKKTMSNYCVDDICWGKEKQKMIDVIILPVYLRYSEYTDSQCLKNNYRSLLLHNIQTLSENEEVFCSYIGELKRKLKKENKMDLAQSINGVSYATRFDFEDCDLVKKNKGNRKKKIDYLYELAHGKEYDDILKEIRYGDIKQHGELYVDIQLRCRQHGIRFESIPGSSSSSSED